MDALQAIIIAIVEGLTEYLPVSSTGHMILTAEFLQVDATPFTKAFMINIQFGAILAVVALYYKRFFKSLDFYFKLFVAFLLPFFFYFGMIVFHKVVVPVAKVSKAERFKKGNNEGNLF